jgi:hypothetical protein
VRQAQLSVSARFEDRRVSKSEDRVSGRTNVHLAEERQHVVLAEAENVNVAHNHHLVVLLVEDGVVNERCANAELSQGERIHTRVVLTGQISLIAVRQKEQRVSGTLRRLEQAFARRILAELCQSHQHSRFAQSLARSLACTHPRGSSRTPPSACCDVSPARWASRRRDDAHRCSSL